MDEVARVTEATHLKQLGSRYKTTKMAKPKPLQLSHFRSAMTKACNNRPLAAVCNKCWGKPQVTNTTPGKMFEVPQVPRTSVQPVLGYSLMAASWPRLVSQTSLSTPRLAAVWESKSVMVVGVFLSRSPSQPAGWAWRPACAFLQCNPQTLGVSLVSSRSETKLFLAQTYLRSTCMWEKQVVWQTFWETIVLPFKT